MHGTEMSTNVEALEEVNGTEPSRAPAGFVLTSDDNEILRLVYEHRFLRRDHLSAITGRHPKRLHRRLLKLVSSKHLTTIRLPQQKHIYGIGRMAIPVLVGEGFTSVDFLEQRLRTSELKPLFLNHEMMIVDVHVALTLASSATRLTSWREGRELYDTVRVVDHKGSAELPIRPDAFFTLLDSRRPDGSNRAHYALEADRSTSTQTRFQDKIRAYWAYIEQARHEKKFGIKGFRILTVTLTDARARNLRALASALLPERGRKHFLFVALRRFLESTDPTGERLCYSSRTSDADLHPLIPAPNQLQKESGVV